MSPGKPYNKGTRKAQFTGSYGDFKPTVVKSDGERFPTDTLYCKTAESESGGRVWHPTQKPVALGRYLIRMYTKPGDVVLDNAFGSGSFLVSAAMEGRRFIGIEKNEEVHLFKEAKIDYVKVAQERLSEVEQSMKRMVPVTPLFSSLQPSARIDKSSRRGMVDVDEVIGPTLRVAI
jgi:site-specific DNA-methyltransferase (adenine-specific)